ncbi:MAG: PLD nuclease N-terminal domain-containing protein [Lachnospiraceae bacterium]|nr:PLD nuclease N-terminal domain-containing protein [Lachnospiraceae bacterium]
MEKLIEQAKEYLPFLIPIVIIQFSLLIYVIRHILTHENYKRGSRTLWLVVSIVLMNFVGPILYLIFGKEDA